MAEDRKTNEHAARFAGIDIDPYVPPEKPASAPPGRIPDKAPQPQRAPGYQEAVANRLGPQYQQYNNPLGQQGFANYMAQPDGNPSALLVALYGVKPIYPELSVQIRSEIEQDGLAKLAQWINGKTGR